MYVYRYIQRKKHAVGKITVNQIHKEYIQQAPAELFPYYYDLPSNDVQTDSASWLPKPVRYTYNNDGMNDRYNYTEVKPPGTVRIITLGDSFDFGMWVDTSQNFSELLEDALNAKKPCSNVTNYEVLNLGAPGYDLRYEYHRYTDKGAKYHPDIVIWFMRDENYYMNSDAYLSREAYYKTQLEATGAAQRLHVSATDRFAPSELAFNEILGSYLGLSLQGKLNYIQPEVSAISGWRAQYDPQLIIVTTTENEAMYKDLMNDFASSHKRTSYIEVSNVETYSPHDYHPDTRGHKTIADALYSFLATHERIACP